MIMNEYLLIVVILCAAPGIVSLSLWIFRAYPKVFQLDSHENPSTSNNLPPAAKVTAQEILDSNIFNASGNITINFNQTAQKTFVPRYKIPAKNPYFVG